MTLSMTPELKCPKCGNTDTEQMRWIQDVQEFAMIKTATTDDEGGELKRPRLFIARDNDYDDGGNERIICWSDVEVDGLRGLCGQRVNSDAFEWEYV